MMKARFLFLVTSLFCLVMVGGEGSSQSMPGRRALFKLAGQYFKDKDFQKAVDVYQQIWDSDHGNPEAGYGLARSYQEQMEYTLAQKWYLKVVESGDRNFPELRYHLGYCEKMLGNYGKAMEQFNIFLLGRPDAPPELFEQANHERNGALLAIDQANVLAGDYGFELLPPPVNTESDEIAVYVQPDGALTILSSRGTTRSPVVKFSTEDGIWFSHFIPLSALGLSEGLELSSVQSVKESDILYVALRPGDRNTWRLAAIPSTGSTIGAPQWLPDRINSRLFNTSDPTTSQEGDTLIFASDRPGGYGGYDLWYTVINGSGEWRAPTNLGEVINTERDERYPFYYGEKQMLFFTSDGHIGYGQMDVFFSSRPFVDPEVVNIGAPFNSGYNDRGLILGPDRGFISSDRKNGIGNYDVYIFEKQAKEDRVEGQDVNTAGSANMKSGMK